MLSPPISGHCLCGDVTWRAEVAPKWQALCHCESCRRATSAPFAAYLCIPDGQWRWTGKAPATHSSSEGVWRDFCPRCGTPMAYRATRYPGEIHFHAMTLQDPAAFQPTIHVHTAEQMPWVRLDDGLRRK